MCPQFSHTLTANCTEYRGPCGAVWRARSTSSIPPTRRGCGHPSGVMSLPLSGVGRSNWVVPWWPSLQAQRSALGGRTRPAKDIPKPQIVKETVKGMGRVARDSARHLRSLRCSVATPLWAKGRFPSYSHFLPEFRRSAEASTRTGYFRAALGRGRRSLLHRTDSSNGRAAC